MQVPPGLLAGGAGEHVGTLVPGSRSKQQPRGQAHWFKHPHLPQGFFWLGLGDGQAGSSLNYSAVKALARCLEEMQKKYLPSWSVQLVKG